MKLILQKLRCDKIDEHVISPKQLEIFLRAALLWVRSSEPIRRDGLKTKWQLQ